MQIAFSCMRAVPRCERHRIVAVFFCLLQSVLLCTTITKQLYLENKTKKKQLHYKYSTPRLDWKGSRHSVVSFEYNIDRVGEYPFRV